MLQTLKKSSTINEIRFSGDLLSQFRLSPLYFRFPYLIIYWTFLYLIFTKLDCAYIAYPRRIDATTTFFSNQSRHTVCARVCVCTILPSLVSSFDIIVPGLSLRPAREQNAEYLYSCVGIDKTHYLAAGSHPSFE